MVILLVKYTKRSFSIKVFSKQWLISRKTTSKKVKMEMKKALRKSMIWFIVEKIWQQRSQELPQHNFTTGWLNGQHLKWITVLSQQVHTSCKLITRDSKHKLIGRWWSANRTWPRSARRNWCNASVFLILRDKFAMTFIFVAILDLYHFSSASKKNRITPKNRTYCMYRKNRP